MAKLTLTDVSSGYGSTSAINSNNDAIETALENTLSRDGTGPNTMSAQLDMNNQRIVNLPDAVADQEPITLSQAGSIAGVENPLTQDSVGAVLYPATTGETNASVTPTNYYVAPYHVTRYGFSTSETAANNATALQSAINAAAHAGHGNVYLDYRGSAQVDASEVYFHYDASDNPNFPSAASRQGNITLIGEGWTDLAAYNNTIYQGTVLDVGADTLLFGDGTANMRACGLLNLTVMGNNSNTVVKFDFCSRGVRLEDITIFQDGLGGGVETDDCFLLQIDQAFAYTTNGSNTGTGWYLHNSSQAAGLYELNFVNARDFNKGFVLGEEGTSAASMSGVHMTSCQGKDCAYNLIIGNGIKTSIIDNFHDEGPTTMGILIAWGAANIEVRASYHSNAGASADYMSIGQQTGTAAADFTRNIHVINNQFIDITNNGIEYYTSTSSKNTRIEYCSFNGDQGTETAIDLEDAVSHGLIIGPNHYTNVNTEVSNPTRADLLITDDTLGLHSYQAPVYTAKFSMGDVTTPVVSQTHVADADTAHSLTDADGSLGATSQAEIEGVLDALGGKINSAFAVLEAIGAMKSS
jgi:hypothetical protein